MLDYPRPSGYYSRSSQLSHIVNAGKGRRTAATKMARILIADDEDDFCRLMQRTLTLAGHEARRAKDGTTAIAALQAAPADVAIVDLYMPGKDGIETILDIRRQFPEVKIIAITGSVPRTGGAILVMAQKLGAHLALAKPFSVEEILTAVKSLLPKPADPGA